MDKKPPKLNLKTFQDCLFCREICQPLEERANLHDYLGTWAGPWYEYRSTNFAKLHATSDFLCLAEDLGKRFGQKKERGRKGVTPPLRGSKPAEQKMHGPREAERKFGKRQKPFALPNANTFRISVSRRLLDLADP